jgi:alpha-N-acetylglucosamine transferase
MIQIKKRQFYNDSTYINDEIANGMYIDEYGNLLWYKDGLLHRDNDKLAVIYISGTQIWYRNGKTHRDNDLPAVIYINGDKHWYNDGVKFFSDNDSKDKYDTN